MQFNPSTCNIICISNKQRPPHRTYFFCGSKLEQVDSASYLGITVNSKLKWSEHISSISNKASRSLGLIKRNLWNCPRKVRETAYTSIVLTQTGVRKCLVGPTLQKRYFNLGESSIAKKSCSLLSSKLQQNSKCDRHVI